MGAQEIDRRKPARLLCVWLTLTLWGWICTAQAGGWIDLKADDAESVRAAIRREVGKIKGYDAPNAQNQLRDQASAEERARSREVTDANDRLRQELKRNKTRRDNAQSELARARKEFDTAANKVRAIEDALPRLEKQRQAMEEEIGRQGELLRRQLASEPLGQVVTAALLSREGIRARRLAALESVADAQASRAAIEALLTHIDSTTLVKDGMVVRDDIVRRVAGEADPAAQVIQVKLGQGLYLRVRSYRLYPLKHTPSPAAASSGDDAAVSARVLTRPEDLQALIQGAGGALRGTTLQEVKELIQESVKVSALDLEGVQAITRQVKERTARKQEDLAAIRDELGLKRKDLAPHRKKHQRLQEQVASAGEELARGEAALRAAQAAYDKSVEAFTKFTFVERKGPIGRQERPADTAIDLTVKALEEVRDDARHHFAESLDRVENGILTASQQGIGAVTARITRFRLVYLSEAEFTDDLNLGVLFETSANGRPTAILVQPASVVLPQKKSYAVTIQTTPSDADVEFTNINREYKDGVQLESGRYDLKVSRQGYKTFIGYVTVEKDSVWTVELESEQEFVDNGNGTVTHTATGLILLKNANCFGEKSWNDAKSSAASLKSGSCGLTDGSVAGDWRLPTFPGKKRGYLNGYTPSIVGQAGELEILLAAKSNPAFTGVQTDYYWSSPTFASSTSNSWLVSLNDGYVGSNGESGSYYVWPVRGGH